MRKNLNYFFLLSFFLTSGVRCTFKSDALYTVAGLGVMGFFYQVYTKMDSWRAGNQAAGQQTQETDETVTRVLELDPDQPAVNLNDEVTGRIQRQGETINNLNRNMQALPGLIKQLDNRFSPTNRTIFFSLTVFTVAQVFGFSSVRLMDRFVGKNETFNDWSKLGVGISLGAFVTAALYKILGPKNRTENRDVLQTGVRADQGVVEVQVAGTATAPPAHEVPVRAPLNVDENGNRVVDFRANYLLNRSRVLLEQAVIFS